MATKYVVTLTHAGGTEDIEITDELIISWTGEDPPVALGVRARELFIRNLRQLVTWLKINGGTKIEIEEIEI